MEGGGTSLMDALAQSYFEKFRVRVEVLPEYHKREAYSDVIREAQEALELFLKGLIRVMGAEPSHTHDPGRELAGLVDHLPKEFKPVASDLIRWSKSLRKDRELSFYGAADFIPTQEYSSKESQEVITFLTSVSKILKTWLVKVARS